jgi:hypothetical protein
MNLEQRVAETAALVVAEQRAIASLDAQLNAANLALAKAKQQGEIHRAKASTGDPAAIDTVKRALDAQHAAESALEEIRRVAMPKAFSQLAAAEQAATNARRALARPHVEALKRQRVEAAARMDAAFAESAAAYADFERLGLELLQYDLGDSGMVSRGEDYRGLRRMYSALPAFMRSLPANPTAKFIPLAESERQFLGLPPEQPDEKVKAA